jgi:hypothetical protein
VALAATRRPRRAAAIDTYCRERSFINVLGETIAIFDRNPAGKQTFLSQVNAGGAGTNKEIV